MKFIEAHDFHASPEWLEHSEAVGRKVRQAATQHKAAFIATSDFWDKPVYATHKGGFNRIKAIVDSWLEICPVVVVQGTPSHDAPGCYDALPGVIVVQPGQPIILNGIQIHGIPELRKDQLQAQLGLPAEQANAEVMQAFRDFIRYVVAPQRASHQGPAVALLHGNVTDSTLTGDVILRASDLVIHTEDLRPACIDRWSLGHIHTPWESNNIFAGYCGFTGMDSNPWGKTGFVPAMNLVDLDTMSLERIPYGTPMRRKIHAPLASYEPTVAYWLETSDHMATTPKGHPWNRLTLKETNKELDRPTEAQAPKSLREWFTIADPIVASKVLDKVDQLEKLVPPRSAVPVEVILESVEVAGCVLFKGRTARMNLTDLADGLNVIRGPNGAGKSSLLAFCHPYPGVLGKDTESGRPSAIKDFFTAKDSWIKKTLRVNGVEHQHLITIKGAHTKNPKTECYLYIDGQNVLDTASFDEMMAECERLYGDYSAYRITTFYEQPLQSRNGMSGIMVANMTNIRDVVQAISGVDRDPEKEQALQKARELDAEAYTLDAKIKGAADVLEDEATLELAAGEQDREAAKAQEAMATLEAQGRKAQDSLNQVRAAVEATRAEEQRKARNESRISEADRSIREILDRRQALNGAVAMLEANREKIRNDDALKIHFRNQDASSRWEQSRKELEMALAAKQELEGVTKALLSHENELQRQRLQERLDSIQACPQCGYMAEDATERYQATKAQLEALEPGELAQDQAGLKSREAKLLGMAGRIQALQAMTPPELEPEEPCDGFPLTNRAQVEATIKMAETAEATIAGLVQSQKIYEDQLQALRSETYRIVEVHGLAEAEAEHQRLQREWKEASQAVHSAIAKAKALRDRAMEVRSQKKALEASRERLEAVKTDSEDWKYIAKMLQPGKIPALEMELVVDTIDAEASRILDDGRQYSTETAEGFDIKVYDPTAGTEKSMLRHSPGEKAFLSDAYVKALIRARNNREHRRYSPVVQDESDGPIQPERLRAYYDQQERFYSREGVKVLVVTHNAEAHQLIANGINIEEVLG